MATFDRERLLASVLDKHPWLATHEPREVALAEVETFAAVGLLQEAIKALEAGAYAHARHLMAEASKLARKAQKAG